jgi:hypothetical protein
MNIEISQYNNKLSSPDAAICNRLTEIISKELSDAENKIWHAHPVWFLDGNPVVGYSKQKAGIRLMFWSGADFEEPELSIRGKKFKDASVFYTHMAQINETSIQQWLRKSRIIQWDYKNIVRRKGMLERLF